MTRDEAVEILTKVFASRPAENFQRLVDYAESGREFLCRERCYFFHDDGCG